MKSQLIIIGVVMAVIILAGVGSFLFTDGSAPPQPPPPSAPPVSQPAPVKETAPAPQPSPPQPSTPKPPPPKPPPPKPPPTFEPKQASLKQAIADVCQSGESQEVTLAFTEAEANEQAAKLLVQTEMPEDIPLEINSIHIDFQADSKVETEVKSVIYQRLKATIKVKAKVSIKEGRPEVEITEVNFGFVQLPKPIKNNIVELISQKIDALLNQLTETETACKEKVDLEFTKIDIQENKLTTTVIVKPKA